MNETVRDHMAFGIDGKVLYKKLTNGEYVGELNSGGSLPSGRGIQFFNDGSIVMGYF